MLIVSKNLDGRTIWLVTDSVEGCAWWTEDPNEATRFWYEKEIEEALEYASEAIHRVAPWRQNFWQHAYAGAKVRWSGIIGA